MKLDVLQTKIRQAVFDCSGIAVANCGTFQTRVTCPTKVEALQTITPIRNRLRVLIPCATVKREGSALRICYPNEKMEYEEHKIIFSKF